MLPLPTINKCCTWKCNCAAACSQSLRHGHKPHCKPKLSKTIPIPKNCIDQSRICSPVENKFHMTVPTRYRMIATRHTSSQVPVFKIMPVAAVPSTPASTPAVLDMPSKTPEYLGAMSCMTHKLTPNMHMLESHKSSQLGADLDGMPISQCTQLGG